MPNGVPAVSDASMSDWMLYVYKQFVRPMNTMGVDVTLNVIDSNNNFREIGTTTSTADGFFTFNWKPDIEGPYTVYANFNGSESYYSSYAVASFVVDLAPVAQHDTSGTGNNSDTVMALTYATIAIIVAIVIIGVLILVLVLRKRQ